jgi:hypothetical protein
MNGLTYRPLIASAMCLISKFGSSRASMVHVYEIERNNTHLVARPPPQLFVVNSKHHQSSDLIYMLATKQKR